MKKPFFGFMFIALLSAYLFCNPADLYQKGAEYQANEDWYGAIEMYQSALKENPSYNLVYQGLAECFYALDEYDQALSFVESARKYKKDDPDLQNLHGFILVGLGKIDAAKTLFNGVLKKYPNNPEARFGLAEIEVSQGKLYLASEMYKQNLQRQSENRKALLSLALVSYEAGNVKQAEDYINRALKYHGDNPQVHYFAAYLHSLDGKLEEAEGRIYSALKLKEDYDEAYALLASVLYAQKRYEEVIKISDMRISKKRDRADAWYLKTLSLRRLARYGEAINAAKVGLSLDADDEIMRCLLEELAIENLNFEDSFRMELSKYHAEKALGFFRRNMTEQALYEYRRTLKIYPYDVESREAYAGILLRLGYPERYLEQMLFIQSIVKSNTKVNDAVEAYEKHLLSSIQSKWRIDPLYLDKAHISIGLFYAMESSNVLHPEAERITQILTSDIFSYNPRIKITSYSDKPVTYREASKKSRTANEDYFGIIRLKENRRDIQIILDLYVSRTGSPAKTFTVYRSGNDRFSNGIRRLSSMLNEAMPIVGKLINRYQNEAVIDIGKHDSDFKDLKIAVIRKDRLVIEKEGLGIVFDPSDLLGYFEPSKSEENLSEGILKRNGYYDRMNAGDSVILVSENTKEKAAEDYTNSYQKNSLLLLLLRKIR